MLVCSKSNRPDPRPTPGPSNARIISAELKAALKEAGAQYFGSGSDAVQIVAAKKVGFRNSSIGLDCFRDVAADVMIPGWQVSVRAEDQTAVYNAIELGKGGVDVRRVAP